MNQKHGGASALKQVTQDKLFTGLAADRLVEIQDQAAEIGAMGMVRRATERLETVAALYMDAIAQAAQNKDTERMTALVKVWGWVQNSASRGWMELAKYERKDDGSAAQAIIDQYRTVQDDPSNS